MYLCASHYPSSQFIASAMHDSGLTRSQFVRALGYLNINGALRSLDRWLQTGIGDPLLFDRIMQHLGLDREGVREVLERTSDVMQAEAEAVRREQEHRHREQFRPFVWVETSERFPQCVTVVAFSGAIMRYIRLPDDLVTWSDAEQLAFVAEAIRQHDQENRGECIFFGDITGYRFVSHYERSIRLTIAGEVIEEKSGIFRHPRCTVQIGNKMIDTSLVGLIEKLTPAGRRG